MTNKLKELAKALTAAAGIAGEAINLGLVPKADQHWVTYAITVATAIAVYLVPNATPVAATK